MLSRKKRTAKNFYSVGAVLFLFFFTLFFNFDAEIVKAVQPDSYIKSVANENLDWQFDEKFLDISNVKETVDAWFLNPDYDFQNLIENPIVIAVIDTGISFSHELFCGEYDENGMPFDNGADIGGYDVFYRDSNGKIICKNTGTGSTDIGEAADTVDNRHGTHVSGIIAALIHELDLEQYIKIMPIKASTGRDNSFTLDNFKKAVSFAVGNGADVINISLGDDGKGGSSSKSWANIDTSIFEPAVCVAAAGNNLSNTAFYPAAYSNVLGVMNYTRSTSGKPEFSASSNYGKWFDVCAPGTNILSADGASKDGYKSLSGTSMATPVVSFASALITLKYRALEAHTGFIIEPVYVRNMIKAHSAKMLIVDSKEFAALDLNTLITADFLNDEKYMDAVYCCDPTSIAITVSNKEAQTLKNLQSCSLHAVLEPRYIRQDIEVEWYYTYNEKSYYIGSGRDASFTPSDGVGIYGVYAKVKDMELTSDISFVNVNYHLISKDNAKIIRTDLLEYKNQIPLGETISFTIEDYKYSNKNFKIKWFVNGELAYIGETFEFMSQYDGTFMIEAKYDDYLLEGVKIKVDETLPYDVEKVYTPLEWVSFGLIGAILLSMTAFLIVLYKRAKNIGYI